ncbi:YiiD C-terminal domain-containing protein [Thalassotalea sp. LPB0316]|uniref:bifunctional GNAT family N-acetyltransferase/hotdog fold thioesterase n=1 Tax=Thalassotalea sp. LPB0316 TaxID=2769490 RepID=UPI0018665945|nr:bifunctional GNAT family N-acetyltransferase/hotdog fold thioesterase [Thalassotalea sp. LPB0316]QOL26009.1 YiiD C-terminal domain-containing protein [Thalassotalea sp. LPB0316]
MTQLASPSSKDEFARYYEFRYQQLRAPWSQPKGSELDEFEASSFHFMLTDDNNHIIGIARLHQVNLQVGQVRYVAVDPNAQGQGLGRRLMAACEQQAKALGLSEIELNAREVALNFYLALGYQNLGQSHLLYGEIQHFSMRKSLELPSLDRSVTQLVETWHATIPASKAMAIEVTSYDRQKLVTRCDLMFNKNLHNTMFAGSINTLATLTGWGWVHLQLRQLGFEGDIVLAQGNINYLAPIPHYSHAVVEKADTIESYQRLKDGRKAKAEITCHVYSGSKIAASFHGVYVVVPQKG